MKTSKKLLAFVIVSIMLITAVPMIASAAAPTLGLGTLAYDASVSGVVTFTVPYTATGVDNVTVLAVIGDSTAMPTTVDSNNIVYINQQAAATSASSFVFNVDTTKIVAPNNTVYIKIGGTAIDTALSGSVVPTPPVTDKYIAPGDITNGTITPVDGVTADTPLGNIVQLATIQITLPDGPVIGGTDSKYVLTACDQDGNPIDGANVFYSVERGKFVGAIPATTATTVKYKLVQGTTDPANVITKYGDVDNSGDINISDLADVAKENSGLITYTDPKTLVTADVNGDGAINISDLADLAKLNSALISVLTIVNN
jgi:hypothetical protein